MVDRERRNNPRLDYNVLHRTGEKVVKDSTSEVDKLCISLGNLTTSKMEQINRMKSKEKKIRNRFKNKSISQLMIMKETIKLISIHQTRKIC